MALYDATGGADWTLNGNWGSSRPLGGLARRHDRCQRPRHPPVACREQLDRDPAGGAGRSRPPLTYLSLEENRLRGPIPAALGGLAALESLALGGNGLSREIPDALGRLTRLQLLSLAGNSSCADRCRTGSAT